jgi:hypothetical protein
VRVTSPPAPWVAGHRTVLEGTLPRGHLAFDVRTGHVASYQLRDVTAEAVHLLLDDVDLSVVDGLFTRCTFEQRAGAVATGSFGAGAARTTYRDCTFVGVDLGRTGLSAGHARYEGCTFRECGTEGFAALDADFVGCRFLGRVDDVTLVGADGGTGTANEVWGNDFRAAHVVRLALRGVDPADQRWPEGAVVEGTADDAQVVVRSAT